MKIREEAFEESFQARKIIEKALPSFMTFEDWCLEEVSGRSSCSSF